MKVKEYIEVKRRYVSPSIYVKFLQMESKLLAGSIKGTDDGEGQAPGVTYPDPYEDPFNQDPNP